MDKRWNRNTFKCLILGGALLSVSAMPVSADPIARDNDHIGAGPFGDVSETLGGTSGRDSLISAHSGYNPDYLGYAHTPILFDPRVDLNPTLKQAERTSSNGLSRKYPSNNWDDLGQLDISVDDDIDKVNMAIFQPVGSMQKSFSEDGAARDAHLELLQSIRGRTISTLSYLDKTLAGALATIQSQADSDVSNHLMKHLAFEASKAANPHRNPFYTMVEEKFEACMRTYSEGAPSGLNVSEEDPSYGLMEEGRFKNFEAAACEERCGTAPGSRSGISDPASPYRFCVCCAETDTSIVATVVEESGNLKSGEERESWSLVRRIFHGTSLGETIDQEIDEVLEELGLKDGGSRGFDLGGKPLGSGNDQLELQHDLVDNFVNLFRTMYGDVVMLREEQTGRQKIKYVPPAYSIPELISQLRDGPNNECDDTTGCPIGNNGNQACKDRSGITFCPITNGKITWGICPSLMYLVDSTSVGLTGEPWVPGGLSGNPPKRHEIPGLLFKRATEESGSEVGGANDVEKLLQAYQLWTEASLGIPLNARDVDNIAVIKYEDPAEALSFVQNFCDASAVAAFKKLHQRMTSLAIDHMVLNRKASDDQKNELRRLLSRVNEYFMLADRDVDAGRRAEAMLTSLATERDVSVVTRITSEQAAFNAEIDRANRGTSMSWFGQHGRGRMRSLLAGGGGPEPS